MLVIRSLVIMTLCGLISSQVLANDKSDNIGTTFLYNEYELSHSKEGVIAYFDGDCSLIKNREHMTVICVSVNANDAVIYTLTEGNTDNYTFKRINKKHKVTAENFEQHLPAGVQFFKPVDLTFNGSNQHIIFFDSSSSEGDLNICKNYAKFAYNIMEGRAKGVIMADVYKGNHIEKEIVEKAYGYFTNPLAEDALKGAASEFSDNYFKACLKYLKK